MRNLKQQHVWRNILQSKPVLIFLGLLILLFSWSVWGFWGKMKETSNNKKLVEDKVAALKEQKDKLSSDISNLNTEEGKEKFLRENYGLVKEGEDLTIVVEDKNLPKTATDASNTGFFSFFKNLFKK